MSEVSDESRSVRSSVVTSIFFLSVALWIGAAAFFSGAVLPALFMNLETHHAGEVAALIFPIYFRAGLVAGLVACVAAASFVQSGGRRWKVAFATLIVMTLAQAWTTLVVYPEITRLRGDDAKVERFQELHKLSVRLNGIVLVGGVLLLAAGGYLFARRSDAA